MKKNFYKFCIDGINKIEQPFNLALLDINLKYKRTVIGSFWSVITYLITISIISIIWSKVFDASFNEFFKIIFWIYNIFINNFISSSSRILYEQYSGIIYGMGVNLNIVLLRHFLLLIFEFFHLLPIYLIIIFLFQININLNMLLFFQG